MATTTGKVLFAAITPPRKRKRPHHHVHGDVVLAAVRQDGSTLAPPDVALQQWGSQPTAAPLAPKKMCSQWPEWSGAAAAGRGLGGGEGGGRATEQAAGRPRPPAAGASTARGRHKSWGKRAASSNLEELTNKMQKLRATAGPRACSKRSGAAGGWKGHGARGGRGYSSSSSSSSSAISSSSLDSCSSLALVKRPARCGSAQLQVLQLSGWPSFGSQEVFTASRQLVVWRPLGPPGRAAAAHGCWRSDPAVPWIELKAPTADRTAIGGAQIEEIFDDDFDQEMCDDGHRSSNCGTDEMDMVVEES